MTDVATLISDAVARVDATAAKADSFLASLLAITNVQFSNGFNIDSLLPNSYDYATTPNASFVVVSNAQRPTIAAPGDAAAPDDVPTFSLPTLTAISLPVDDLLAPTNQFEFYEAAYASTLLDPLKAKLLDNLTNGGYGIETADEQLLFQRAVDREVGLTNIRIDEAGHAMAARGFPLPPGELSISIDRAYQELQDKASSVSRDIVLKRADLYVENRKFTIVQTKELEQILIGFHNSVQERALNVAKATAEFAILVYNALLARYRARLDAAKANSEVQFQQVQAAELSARATLDAYRAKLTAYEANIRRLVDISRAQVELYRADVDVDRLVTDAVIARTKLQNDMLNAAVQQNIQISNLAIENAKAKLLATVEALKFKTAATQYGAEKFYATLTAMLNSVQALAVQTASA